jgi:hypothetical protein
MTALTDHIERIRDAGGDLLEWTLESDIGMDTSAGGGFAMAAVDGDDQVMIIEVGINGDRRGIHATITTYDENGNPRLAPVSSLGAQTMVTLTEAILDGLR